MSRETVPDLRLHTSLPRPIFPPRGDLIKITQDRFLIRLLNRERSFTIPFEWHSTDLEQGTRLWKLNLHYMEFLEGVGDADFSRIVRDWIENNPPYRPGYWRDNWNSYALAIRCVVWMQQFAARRHALEGEFSKRMLESLFRQVRFLSRNLELDIGGNHLIKNIKTLLWAGRFFDVEEASRWQDLGRVLLENELKEQILSDGMHFERSPAYHGQVFADLVECYSILEPGGLKERLRASLGAMAQVVIDTTHPDALTSMFNDGGLRMTYQPGVTLAFWQRLTGETVKSRHIFHLESAGYCGLRNEDSFLLVDCGKIAPDHLPAHGHGDIFAFEWTVDGRRFIVDTGVFEYDAGPRRAYSRSTRAHNTATLDGVDQCEFWGSFRVARRARLRNIRFHQSRSGFTISGAHNGYANMAGSPIHRRTVEAGPDRIHVIDEFEGGKSQKAESRLLFHPDCKVEEMVGGLAIRQGSTTIHLRTGADVAIITAPWYPDFGVEIECPQVVLYYGTAPCRGEFWLERIPLISSPTPAEFVHEAASE